MWRLKQAFCTYPRPSPLCAESTGDPFPPLAPHSTSETQDWTKVILYLLFLINFDVKINYITLCSAVHLWDIKNLTECGIQYCIKLLSYKTKVDLFPSVLQENLTIMKSPQGDWDPRASFPEGQPNCMIRKSFYENRTLYVWAGVCTSHTSFTTLNIASRVLFVDC